MIHLTTIAPGNQGTRETLMLMAGLAREAGNDTVFSQFASQFVFADNLNHIDSILRPYYDYTDENVETLYDPVWNHMNFVLTGKIIGDCDDIAMFYAAIFHVLGFSTRYVAMRTKRNDPEFYHVVVEGFEDGRWKRFDPTVIPSLLQYDFGRMVEYV